MSGRENQDGFAARRIDSVRHVTVIEVVTTEGAGTSDDIVHRVTRYFAPSGELLAVSLAEVPGE